MTEGWKEANDTYRPNAEPLNTDQWELHIKELIVLAERSAAEIASLARNGGDADRRVKEQEREAVKFQLDRRLNMSEMDKALEIYRQSFLSALEREASPISKPQVTSNSAASNSGCLGVLAIIGLLPLFGLMWWLYA